MMKKEDFQDIVARYVNGVASQQEQRLLEEYYRRLTEQADHFPSLPAEDEERLRLDMLTAILERSGIPESPVVTIKSRGWHKYKIAAAAAILIGVSFGTYFLIQNNKQTRPVVAAVPVKTDVPPGGNKAILTLGNGSKIILDSAANGSLAMQGSTNIIKTDSGKLAYNASTEKPTSSEIVLNTLTTPRGGQFQLTLHDGTKVWLNAASSITYPTAFIGKERNVTITGEAYLEVVHNDKMPFRVQVGDQTIEDIGTAFNINAYTDELSINTTLLEGSIRIKQNAEIRLLKPGEQSLSTDKGIRVIKNVDLDYVMAWKNGKMQIENGDVKKLFREISRWYNVDVEYRGAVPEGQFAASIKRNLPLSNLLNVLNTDGVKTHFADNKIVVE